MTITEFMAFWGAIISTITLTWNISLFLRDKAKINVVAGIMIDENRKEFFVVQITNIGKRPALIKSVNLQEKNSSNKIFIAPQKLPIKLNETETHIEYYDNVDKFQNTYEKIWVSDSTGKDWYVNRKSLKYFNNQITKKKNKNL